MTVKRKRSSNFSSPPTTTTLSRDNSSSSPLKSPSGDALTENFYGSYFPLCSWMPDTSPPPPTSTIDKHLHARTRKRFRNSRPTEERVHENTYNILFAAARSPSTHRLSLPTPSATVPTVTRSPSLPRTQSSLNAFWHNLPPAPASLPAANSLPLSPLSSNPTLLCEDCDAPLLPASEDTAMGGVDSMDIDIDDEEEGYACRACKRRVCGMCAVVETGFGRECLGCRTSGNRRRLGSGQQETHWVGGIGWMP